MVAIVFFTLFLGYTAEKKNIGQSATLEGAMAKYFASEASVKVSTEAIQILGGYGYTKDYNVERYFRDAKVTEIYEGTSQVQQIVIARECLK